MNGEGASVQDDSEEKMPSQHVPKLHVQQQQRGLFGISQPMVPVHVVLLLRSTW